jgi:hypothetical protein
VEDSGHDLNEEDKPMRTLRGVAGRLSLAIAVLAFMVSPAPSQTGVNVTTWHNDNYRTGQNTSETTLNLSNVNKTHFGLLCKITLLPQIQYQGQGYNQVYAQPLVIWNGGAGTMTVYVATMNDYVYAYTVPASWNGSCSGVATSVVTRNLLDLYSDEEPAMCANVGSTMCLTVAPAVGVLGTPVIDSNTNTLYLVADSEAKDLSAFHHRVHALDAATLVEKYGGPASIPSTMVGHATFDSKSEMQRPGLLLTHLSSLAYPTLYIAFSMMDGTHPLPSGWIFAYDAQNLMGQPLFPKVYATTPGIPLPSDPGGGTWMAGAGLATGTDESGTNFLYFSTADGFFDLNNGSPPNTPMRPTAWSS